MYKTKTNLNYSKFVSSLYFRSSDAGKSQSIFLMRHRRVPPDLFSFFSIKNKNWFFFFIIFVSMSLPLTKFQSCFLHWPNMPKIAQCCPRRSKLTQPNKPNFRVNFWLADPINLLISVNFRLVFGVILGLIRLHWVIWAIFDLLSAKNSALKCAQNNSTHLKFLKWF